MECCTCNCLQQQCGVFSPAAVERNRGVHNDNLGQTPLMMAAKNGHTSIIGRLEIDCHQLVC